jgi:hypothetical protein
MEEEKKKIDGRFQAIRAGSRTSHFKDKTINLQQQIGGNKENG